MPFLLQFTNNYRNSDEKIGYKHQNWLKFEKPRIWHEWCMNQPHTRLQNRKKRGNFQKKPIFSLNSWIIFGKAGGCARSFELLPRFSIQFHCVISLVLHQESRIRIVWNRKKFKKSKKMASPKSAKICPWSNFRSNYLFRSSLPVMHGIFSWRRLLRTQDLHWQIFVFV